MDVARLNFSHGGHEDHQKRLNLVRAAAERAGRPVAILQDLQGPKIRVGRLKGGKAILTPGQTVTITTRDVLGAKGIIPTTYRGLPGDVRKGEAVLLNDGRLRLLVLSVGRQDVKCKVEIGGILTDQKGINLPESDVSTSSLTEKDVQDALFGREMAVDYMALSFVRSAEDVAALRKVVGPSIPLIAKIEKPQAVDRINEIAQAADGVMVARGDLGVELPLERVPLVQKTCIERTTHEGKLAIVATEMLESMIESPRPTRAEVSDVANAILDGTDAVMLSGETATGKYPIDAVRTMGAIIEEVEHSPRFRARPTPALDRNDSFATAVARASVAAAQQLGISTIVSCTETGRSARLLSEHRPSARVVAFTPLQETYRRLALYWGVTPFVIPSYATTDEMLLRQPRAARARALPAGRGGRDHLGRAEPHRQHESDDDSPAVGGSGPPCREQCRGKSFEPLGALPGLRPCRPMANAARKVAPRPRPSTSNQRECHRDPDCSATVGSRPCAPPTTLRGSRPHALAAPSPGRWPRAPAAAPARRPRRGGAGSEKKASTSLRSFSSTSCAVAATTRRRPKTGAFADTAAQRWTTKAQVARRASRLKNSCPRRICRSWARTSSVSESSSDLCTSAGASKLPSAARKRSCSSGAEASRMRTRKRSHRSPSPSWAAIRSATPTSELGRASRSPASQRSSRSRTSWRTPPSWANRPSASMRPGEAAALPSPRPPPARGRAAPDAARATRPPTCGKPAARLLATPHRRAPTAARWRSREPCAANPSRHG